MDETYEVRPVAVVRGPRDDPSDGRGWGDVESVIEVDERLGPGALEGLDGFSHVEVVFVFDGVQERDDHSRPRRPLDRDDMPPIGVFADRGPDRPNRLGHSAVAIVSVDGRRLTVRGLDAVDGTPVLDLKPVMTDFLPDDVREPPWARRLMEHYFEE